MRVPNNAFALGKYGDCIKELHRILRRQNQRLSVEEKAELNCNLAFCHLYLELYRKAATYCESALDMDPTCTRALLYKGKAFYRLGKKNEALSLFEEGLKYSHDLQYTAEILSCIQEIREEIRPPEECQPVNGLVGQELCGSGPATSPSPGPSPSPTPPPGDGGLGRQPNGDLCDSQRDMCSRSEGSLKPSLSVNAQKEGRSGSVKSVEWKSQVSKQITLDQLDMEVKISLGFAMVNQGKYNDAIQLFNEIIDIEPNNIKALVGRGSAKAMSKDLKGGEADFSAAIYVEPDVVEAWKRRGQVRVALGKNQLALSDFSRAQHLLGDEEDVDIQKEIGLVYQNKGDHRMALVYLMKAEKILESADTLDAVVARATWNAMGLAYNSLGQPDEAVKVYSKALCLFPDFKEANVNVAQSYKELAMLPEGLKHFDKGLELDQNCVITMNLKSLSLHNAGLILEAYNTLSRALSVEPDNPDSLYMHGVCAHGLGRFASAVRSYDEMLRDQAGHFSYYLRQMALYQFHQLDQPLNTYNANHHLHPCFKEAWTKRLDPSVLPSDFVPQVVPPDFTDVTYPQTLQDDMLSCLKASQPYGKKIQYNSVGFLQNGKQQRWAGLAILEMAQSVARLWQAMRTGDIDGCTVSGQHSSGVTCDHVFGWRDLFDIAVKWRQLSEPQDSVWWIDLLNPKAFAEGFGSQTPMILAGNRVVRYYPYFLRALTLIKEHMTEQCSLCPEQADHVNSATSCEDLLKIMNRDFYIVLPCPSLADPRRVMEGTRLTVQHAEPRSYTCSIRTPCTPTRWVLFDEELKLAWQQLCDLTTSPRVPSIEKQVDCVINLVYYWYNMMPLTRGTAACGLVSLYSLILGLGYDITAPLPQGMQWDWEAIFLGSPERFAKVVKAWILPNLKAVHPNLLADLPCVATTFKTLRDVITVLNHRRPPPAAEDLLLRHSSRESTSL